MRADREESMGAKAGSTEPKRPFWRSHPWWTWLGGSVLFVAAALAIAVSIALQRAEPYVRARIVSALGAHFHAHVELDKFQMSLWGGLWAEGKGLEIWPPSQEGSPATAAGAPLIRVAEFRFHAPLHYEPGKPFHIAVMQIRGLDVDLPPKERFAHLTGGAAQAGSGAGALHFDVGTIECTDGHLTLETSKPGKLPLEFAIARLKLTNVNLNGPVDFDAEVTNPKPTGTIYTKGTFGPWVVDDPGESALAGKYRFEHADLASFRGIAGTLNSTGNFSGTLRNITVDGVTETPDFRLTMGGNAMNLRTRFHALVNGTDGDTWLQPVDATLGNSHLIAKGKIVRVRAVPPQDGKPAQPGGHEIALTVNVDRGRIEDFLQLTTRDPTPLLTGALALQTTLEIPPGPLPVRDRLKLDGTFTLNDARFTSSKIQDRIDELSQRGEGKTKSSSGLNFSDVRSTMQGSFQMAAGVITLPNLQYTVPGAEIDLKGTYGVAGGALNFSGKARMQATVSQMVGGWKGILLKPVDKFFEHQGAGTVLPVVIEGTRQDPQFGVDFGGLKKTSPQRDGGP
ncbi:MAG TPA: AsmA-like C-terminal region-containing protein [Terracidiphilus sp.]|nr:AsmA-like C-terminal region-containing protein [Terracidiphilus sp.]